MTIESKIQEHYRSYIEMYGLTHTDILLIHHYTAELLRKFQQNDHDLSNEYEKMVNKTQADTKFD